MKLYIVARPFEEIEEFIPVYITNHKDKAIKFWKLYTDESIMLIIFSKEWDPNDPKNFPNIIFNYLDYLNDKQDEDMIKNNTLYGKYKEWIEQDLNISEAYMFGDPEAERDEYGIMLPKIWDLNNEKN